MMMNIELKLECDCKGFDEHNEPYAIMEWIQGGNDCTVFECPECKRIVKLQYRIKRQGDDR